METGPAYGLLNVTLCSAKHQTTNDLEKLNQVELFLLVIIKSYKHFSPGLFSKKKKMRKKREREKKRRKKMFKKFYFELTCDLDLVTLDGQIKRAFAVTFRNFSVSHLLQRKPVLCRFCRPRS